ncbi:MAG: alternative ribosome rescue aminoacyl-tRNA hydrolase ArfB [Desulfatiglandales bacterium]|jgi:ribosome-associated protein
MIRITPSIAIDETEIEWAFIRASGPGGQNVNKVATAVQLRFPAGSSASLPEDARARLIRLAGKRMSKEGILVIDARRFRTQEQNRRDAMERLIELLQRAAKKPRKRIKTNPTAASRLRRLASKLQRGQTKKARRKVRSPDE